MKGRKAALGPVIGLKEEWPLLKASCGAGRYLTNFPSAPSKRHRHDFSICLTQIVALLLILCTHSKHTFASTSIVRLHVQDLPYQLHHHPLDDPAQPPPTSTSNPYYAPPSPTTMLPLLPLTLLPSFATSLIIPRQQPSPIACNNTPDLCSRTYDSILHLGAHDSPFLTSGTGSLSLAGNQNIPTPSQLDLGVRLLTAQVHRHDDDRSLHLCHTSCSLLDAGLLRDWLSSIKEWLDSNTNDIVTILLVNSDNAPLSDLDSEFEASGLKSLAYTPSPPDSEGKDTEWPTLQSMLDARKRLVTFIASPSPSPSSPQQQSSSDKDEDKETSYLLNEWTHIFETPYNVTTPSGFTCTPDRPSTSPSVMDGKLPLVNHMLYTSLGMNVQTASPDTASIINGDTGAGEGNLGDAVDACGKDYGEKKKKVWGVLIDFVDVGKAIEVVDRVNGVKGAVGRKGVNGGKDGKDGGDGGKDEHGRKGGSTAAPSPTHAVEEFKGQAAGVERGVSKAVLGAAAGVCGLLAMC